MSDNGEKVTPIRRGLNALYGLTPRAILARLSGAPFDGKRNLYASFGWPATITSDDILGMYNRGGIARRIVHAYADATWGRPPTVYVDGNTAWNDTWDAFTKKTQLWAVLYRLDVLASLGRFAILVLGTDRPNLESPLRNPREVTFLQPYGEFSVRIKTWDTNPTSSNFGRPLMYTIYPDGDQRTSGEARGVTGDIGPSRRPFNVHYSRVLHVAKGGLEDEVFGSPMYSPIWNYLIDLEKVVGASAESYWLSSNRGMQADVDKDMDMDAEEAAALEDEIDKYVHGFRRFIRSRGVKINALKTDVADPKGAFDVLITLVSGTTGIPQRILLGSEAGQLASTQDKGNWAERVEEYRTLHANPRVLGLFINRMLELELLSAPGGEVKILWPDAYRMSPLERGQTAAQTARTLANAMKAMEPTVVAYERVEAPTPAPTQGDGVDGTAEGNKVVANAFGGTKPAPQPSGPIYQDRPVYGEPLITREEARAIVGLSTDNQVLAKDPDI